MIYFYQRFIVNIPKNGRPKRAKCDNLTIRLIILESNTSHTIVNFAFMTSDAQISFYITNVLESDFSLYERFVT